MSADAIAPGLPPEPGLGEEPLSHFARVYALFCQGLFQQRPAGDYKWSDDDHISEIFVTDQVPIPRDNIERRPAIVTMRGQAQWGNTSLDQMRTVDARTGAKERTDLVACTMTLNCIAKMGTEAQRIAWILMRHLRDFRVMLQRVGGFHQVADNISVGPESPPGAIIAGEGDIEAVMVSVYSPFYFQWTERVTPLTAPSAQSIEAHLRAGIPQFPVDTQGLETEVRAGLRGPTIRGRPLVTNPETRVFPIEQTVKT